MKLENIERFIEEMSEQVEKTGYGKIAIQWRKDLQSAKNELHNVAMEYEMSSKRSELSFKAFAETYLSDTWN